MIVGGSERLKTLRESACADVKQERAKLAESNNLLETAKVGQEILQEIAAKLQNIAHERLASIVSRCLQAVFDEPYEFQIAFEQKRGKTEAVLSFAREGITVDPLSSSGGGVVDVAAFAMRIACMTLRRPKVRSLVVLDEPFKFVSEEYRDRVKQMLELLSVELGVQFVIITHIKELEAGKVIRI